MKFILVIISISLLGSAYGGAPESNCYEDFLSEKITQEEKARDAQIVIFAFGEDKGDSNDTLENKEARKSNSTRENNILNNALVTLDEYCDQSIRNNLENLELVEQLSYYRSIERKSHQDALNILKKIHPKKEEFLNNLLTNKGWKEIYSIHRKQLLFNMEEDPQKVENSEDVKLKDLGQKDKVDNSREIKKASSNDKHEEAIRELVIVRDSNGNPYFVFNNDTTDTKSAGVFNKEKNQP